MISPPAQEELPDICEPHKNKLSEPPQVLQHLEADIHASYCSEAGQTLSHYVSAHTRCFE